MRAERRKQLFRLLGDLPDRRPISVETLRIEEREENIVETLLLDLNGHEKAPAYFVKPKKTEGPCPAVLFQHSHGGQYDRGKSELIEGVLSLKNPNSVLRFFIFYTYHNFVPSLYTSSIVPPPRHSSPS